MDLPQQRPHHDILSIFKEEQARDHGFLRVSAPMVRYSKLVFRKLLREQGVALSFTPMIIADSFIHSEKARQNEFSTSLDDQPLIAQFAAKDSMEFATAAQLIYPYVDGIDLNCGCPQSWAMAKGYGCGLLRQPELIRDIVQNVRRTMPQDFSISVKIRLLNGDSVKSTVQLARQLEQCGVTFLSLHGRTASQKRAESALNIPAMAEVKQSIQMPLIVNGSVRSWKDACNLYEQTQADGVMAARGLLANPALFNPIHCDTLDVTPLECIRHWLNIATAAGEHMSFQTFHHHLVFMWSSQLAKPLRLKFNKFNKKSDVFEFFEEHYSLRPVVEYESMDLTKCTYDHFTPPVHKRNLVAKFSEDDENWSEENDGKYFTSFQQEANDKRETNLDDNDAEEELGFAGSFLSDLN